MHSLQFRLSLGASIAIILMASVAGAFSYWWAFKEAIELQDEQLSRLSDLVNQKRLFIPDGPEPPIVSSLDPESHFVVQLLQGSPASNVELPGLPVDLADGLQTRVVDDVSWRILVATSREGVRVVIGQQTNVRDEIAGSSALNTLIPLILLIPLLLLFLSYIIKQVFSPLQRMAQQLDNSTHNKLALLPEHDLATEIAPFVLAINRLLARLGESIAQQRRFVRDAAHELRSPLTAISLQAERLIELGSDSELLPRLTGLHRATSRTRVLIEQLLTLARAQEERLESPAPLSLKVLLREVVEDLVPLADAKRINLSVEGQDITVVSYAIDLQILVKNLIDNAIRYTPENGSVELILEQHGTQARLIVQDSGPGIASDEQERVFDAFYRVLGGDQIGSGLGLSIVRTISERIGVQLSLINRTGTKTGLSVTLIFGQPGAELLSI